jgi:hypothetical protein
MKIYLHKACFDGVASAAAAMWFLEEAGRGRIQAFEPVDYDLRSSWHDLDLGPGACVVDFLYHRGALCWWDHHPTTFLDTAAEAHYRARQSSTVAWDPDAPSCAGLIAGLAESQGYALPDHLRETARWADKLDTASYSSPDEAVLDHSAARQIALSFHVDSSAVYHEAIVRALASMPLEEVASLPASRPRLKEALRRYAQGIDLVRVHSVFQRGIVVYDVAPSTEIVDRMIAYYLFPTADYAVGVFRTPGRVRVTCNASPWRRPVGPDLGKLFARLGGGGHEYVGSVILTGEGTDSIALVVEQIIGHLRERQPEEALMRRTESAKS